MAQTSDTPTLPYSHTPILRESARRRRAGFTLMEILVVVMIIAILATIVGVKVIPRLGQAKTEVARAQIGIFKKALQLYRMDNGMYPSQQQGLNSLVEMPTADPVPTKYRPEGYLESRKVPMDPWTREYVYLVPGPDGAPFEILSYGADGQPGGEGDDMDLSSAGL